MDEQDLPPLSPVPSPSPSPLLMFNPSSDWDYILNPLPNNPWRVDSHQEPCKSSLSSLDFNPDQQPPPFIHSTADLIIPPSSSSSSLLTAGNNDGSPSSSSDDTTKSSKTVKKKGAKRIKQPRIALVTKSEVEHLEDGYRWRKYGQKGVKNSPFPRSYYKCTYSRCIVKKRVERSSADPSNVITTYVGQHSHPNPDSIRASRSINRSHYGLQSPSFASNPSHPFHLLDSSSSSGGAFQQTHGSPMEQPMRIAYESHGIDEGLLEDMLPHGVRGP